MDKNYNRLLLFEMIRKFKMLVFDLPLFAPVTIETRLTIETTSVNFFIVILFLDVRINKII